MKKAERLARARNLLGQALQALPDGQGLSEAKGHVKRAINEVEKKVKKEGKKAASTNHENWMGNVEAGIANIAASPMSAQAQMRALDALDKMIEDTRSELDKLEDEKEKKKPTEIPDLFLQD